MSKLSFWRFFKSMGLNAHGQSTWQVRPTADFVFLKKKSHFWYFKVKNRVFFILSLILIKIIIFDYFRVKNGKSLYKELLGKKLNFIFSLQKPKKNLFSKIERQSLYFWPKNRSRTLKLWFRAFKWGKSCDIAF